MGARPERPTQKPQNAQKAQTTRKADRAAHLPASRTAFDLMGNDPGRPLHWRPGVVPKKTEPPLRDGRMPGAIGRPGLLRLLPILPILRRSLETRSHARPARSEAQTVQRF